MTLGSHAACSKQMPACEDNHRSSHTEADCAGSPFHSNKGTRAEHRRLVQTEPAWAHGEVRDAGRGAREGFHKDSRLEVVLGMKSHSQGQVLHFISGSSAILASPTSHTRGQWAPLIGWGWEARSSTVLDSKAGPEDPEPHFLVLQGPQARPAQDC